jgi:hypothetical protein
MNRILSVAGFGILTSITASSKYTAQIAKI